MVRILVAGTGDTKGEELHYIAHSIRDAGGEPIIIDLGISDPSHPVDIRNQDIAHYDEDAKSLLGSSDRGPAVAAMGRAFARFCHDLGLQKNASYDAAIGIGGGGGTSIVSSGFRSLPIGFPKLIVSTMASGNVAPYVDIADIGMIYSVTDLAGLNRLSRTILRNAAFAIVGMAKAGRVIEETRPSIGLTMFGVTTPCVTAIVDQLKGEFDCLVFHATGSGGRAMEKLIDSGMIERVIDVTTTEIADELCGGILTAGPDRLAAIARSSVPYVGSIGACDMVNFGAPDTIPAKFNGRLFYKHNPQVTLMRTTADECAAIGRFIGEKLNACSGPVHILIPEGGISMLDAPGQVFHDPDADHALIQSLEHTLIPAPNRKCERLPYHINAPEFASALVQAFRTQSH